MVYCFFNSSGASGEPELLIVRIWPRFVPSSLTLTPIPHMLSQRLVSAVPQ
jgi:hypothetical protein